MDECKPLVVTLSPIDVCERGVSAVTALARARRLRRLPQRYGRAVQVDLIKPTFKAPGTKRLKLKYVKLPSSFAFKFNLRRYAVSPRYYPRSFVHITGGDLAGPCTLSPFRLSADYVKTVHVQQEIAGRLDTTTYQSP